MHAGVRRTDVRRARRDRAPHRGAVLEAAGADRVSPAEPVRRIQAAEGAAGESGETDGRRPLARIHPAGAGRRGAPYSARCQMEIFGFDAYSPKEIAAKLEAVGVTKARLPLLAMAMLGMVAGGFIGLGALYYTVVVADTTLPFAASRVLGGVAFSLGLILVVVAGAELFTGNNLLVMAWADRRITTAELARNWLVIYVSNAFGAIGLVAIVYLSQHGELDHGAVAAQYVKIAA